MLVLKHVNAPIKFEKNGRCHWQLGYRSQTMGNGIEKAFSVDVILFLLGSDNRSVSYFLAMMICY